MHGAVSFWPDADAWLNTSGELHADAKRAAAIACGDCAGITFNGMIQLLAFCLFEVMVGLFWPSMMKMRAEYVPEEMRATIINFFRIPLNLFVCVILYNVRSGHYKPISSQPCHFIRKASACTHVEDSVISASAVHMRVDTASCHVSPLRTSLVRSRSESESDNATGGVVCCCPCDLGSSCPDLSMLHLGCWPAQAVLISLSAVMIPTAVVPNAQVSSFPLALMFGMCSAFLCLATVCQMRLENLTAGPEYSAVTAKDDLS